MFRSHSAVPSKPMVPPSFGVIELRGFGPHGSDLTLPPPLGTRYCALEDFIHQPAQMGPSVLTSASWD